MLTLIIQNVIQVLILLIIAEVVISYLIFFRVRINLRNPLFQFVHQVTEPMLAPVRRILPPRATGNLDLSPMIVILLLEGLASLLR